MLTHLHIRDLAIVENLELDFAGGLTVLTGETGAGKSIVVDALTLICGARAAADQIRAGADKAEVAASFDIRQLPRPLRLILEEQSIEAEDELLVRRVITADGRSRAYLNGQSVAVQLLRDVVGSLLDVHGQHEFQSLVRSAAQRELLDRYGRLDNLAGQVEIAHATWLTLLNRQLEIETRLRDRDARLELLRFQTGELSALDLKTGEAAELASEATRLGHRGRLLEGTQLAAQLLYEGEGDTAQAQLARAQAALKPLLGIDSALEGILPLLEEASIRVTEAARELGRYVDGMDMDTARQATVEKRLAAAEELARKHRVPVGDLPQFRLELQNELTALESAEQDVATLRRQQTEALQVYRDQAGQLSEARTATAATLGKEITARMQTLGMNGGRFQVEISPHASAEPQPHGLDLIEFRVTANPGQPLRPLAKVASGGELARLSLAVQVACTADERRCMVFDEVDAGIGGAVAEVVGLQLRGLGSRSQVLCVTHLAQVAAQGHHHLRVLKLTDGKTTRTSLTELSGQERVREIARMLGGAQITDKALAHAREMLSAPARNTGDTARIQVAPQAPG
ncbi:MAG TPA: DNA repair protein RecN [Steroidobacteraceae bacterium]|nr:DNA repair protein RecN [Steroidobacteraceae bacterium]